MDYTMILDTETVGLIKPFTYDIGFLVLDEDLKVVDSRHYIIEQIYRNKELFATAYYSTKKPKYTNLMKGKKAEKIKLGHATQKIATIIKKYGITKVYAYNSNFDRNALKFTTEFYKVKNPFASLQFIDIMILAKKLYNSCEYQAFAIKNDFTTEKGNLKHTAETVYAFIIGDSEYKEEHLSIPDCKIELEILKVVRI